MGIYEILINALTVGSLSFVIAKTINFSQESRDNKIAEEKEEVRKLHLSALLGDSEAADKWSEITYK